MRDTRERILDVATDVLGIDPDASMGDVAAAADVVRRTVYGHFASRSDLVLALTRRAVDEITGVVADVTRDDATPDEAWAAFVHRLWPLVHRYRVLVALRRGELGEQIHALLGPVETGLADLVRRGQASGAFGRHLPAEVLSQVAWSTVFTLADHDLDRDPLGVPAVTTTSLLVLGVPGARAQALADPDVTAGS